MSLSPVETFAAWAKEPPHPRKDEQRRIDAARIAVIGNDDSMGYKIGAHPVFEQISLLRDPILAITGRPLIDS